MKRRQFIQISPFILGLFALPSVIIDTTKDEDNKPLKKETAQTAKVSSIFAHSLGEEFYMKEV